MKISSGTLQSLEWAYSFHDSSRKSDKHALITVSLPAEFDQPTHANQAVLLVLQMKILYHMLDDSPQNQAVPPAS